MAVLNVEATADALALAAARRIAHLLQLAIARSSARFCLTGGDSPRAMYRLLAQPADDPLRRVDWSKVDLFWGDERHVPPDHPDSNFGMANELLVKPAHVPPTRLHRMRGELPDAAQAAREYDDLVRGYARPDGAPTFDVMLLGLGPDAHIASLFPGSAVLQKAGNVGELTRAVQRERAGRAPTPRAAAVWAAHLQAWRITLTPPAILDSAVILVLTAGAGKAEAVRAAVRGEDDLVRWPAQLLRAADARVEWWLDRAAAAAL